MYNIWYDEASKKTLNQIWQWNYIGLSGGHKWMCEYPPSIFSV
jgi:hypothetical protein